jgi:HPt (histidine-containing phosphotransfer) domain-containing protein
MEATQKLYDLTMVESISGGDQSFIRKMVQLFIDTMPQNVSELQSALQQENWEMVGKQAHKMKSTIDSMGIDLLKDDIRAVESNGKNKTNLEAVPALVTKVADTIQKCISQIKNDFGL